MKIVINPKYNELTSFVNSIPSRFGLEGEMIYDERNQLKRYSAEGYDLIVKRFRKPHIINQIAYSFIRPSKAERSYRYALLLLEKGISTPSPIAFIEDKKAGLLNYSYYICLFEKEYSHIRKQMLGEEGGKVFQKELAIYIAGLHNKGILNNDLSPGNILFRKEGTQVLFSLIDINRMRFMKNIPLETRYKNFKRISENTNILTYMAKEYAKACSLNEEEAVRQVNKYCAEFYKKRF